MSMWFKRLIKGSLYVAKLLFDIIWGVAELPFMLRLCSGTIRNATSPMNEYRPQNHKYYADLYSFFRQEPTVEKEKKLNRITKTWLNIKRISWFTGHT